MRKTLKLSTGAAFLAAGLALSACGGSETVTEDDTAVSDVDPGEADGTIDDTTAIDATIGADSDAAVDGVAPDGTEPEEGAEDGAVPAEEDGDGEAEGETE